MIDGERSWRRISNLGVIGKQEARSVTSLSFTEEERSARTPRGTCSAGEGKESGLTRRPRRPAGIAGVLTATYLTVQGTTIGQLFPFLPGAAANTNVGIVALVVNFVVNFVVSLAIGGLAVRREQSA